MEATNGAADAATSQFNYRTLDFTDAQYEKALRRVKSPNDFNQLLVALIEVSAECGVTSSAAAECMQSGTGQQPSAACSLVGTSDYSSTTSFASPSTSSNQSLESLTLSQQRLGVQPDHAQTASAYSLDGLRRIYIDGSNVARTHGNNHQFSWLGIKICVDWFLSRGHKVKVLIPEDKCHHVASSGQPNARLLEYLRQVDALIETPTGCNDDMFIIEAARQKGGVIVSNDLYRDERRRFGSTENMDQFIYFNRLPYIFDDDLFIPASDPRGRSGPKLDEFLRSQHVQDAQQNQEYGLHLYNTRPHTSRSLPAERMIKRPLIVEDQTNQPAVDSLIQINQTAHRQVHRPIGNQSPGQHQIKGHQRATGKGLHQQSNRTLLGRTRSHNF